MTMTMSRVWCPLGDFGGAAERSRDDVSVHENCFQTLPLFFVFCYLVPVVFAVAGRLNNRSLTAGLGRFLWVPAATPVNWRSFLCAAAAVAVVVGASCSTARNVRDRRSCWHWSFRIPCCHWLRAAP